jgi:hypothetical protein
MVAPVPVNPPCETHMAPSPKGLMARLPHGVRTTRNFLRSFGFHVVAALLGIALAFL